MRLRITLLELLFNSLPSYPPVCNKKLSGFVTTQLNALLLPNKLHALCRLTVCLCEREDEAVLPISTECGPWPVTSAMPDVRSWERRHACAHGLWITANVWQSSAFLRSAIVPLGELVQINYSAVQLLLPTGELCVKRQQLTGQVGKVRQHELIVSRITES